MGQREPAACDIAIIGGGPGGYEAALVAAQLGAEVTVVEDSGLGGSCVLTDCVPSKTLIATSSLMAAMEGSGDLGIRFDHDAGAERQRHGQDRPLALHGHARADAPLVYARIRRLAQAQSADVAARLDGRGRRGRHRARAGSPGQARSPSATARSGRTPS